MPTYFIGGGVECYQTSPTGVSDSADSVRLSNGSDAYFADCIPRDPTTGARVYLDNFWFHTTINGYTINLHAPVFYNANDVPVLRLMSLGGDRVQFQRWIGGAWVDTGPQVFFSGQMIYDIRIVAHPTAGRLSFVVNGVSVVELSGIDTSGLAGIGRVRLGPLTNNNQFNYTEYVGTIIASYNTIGHVVRRRTPSSDRLNTGWSGSYTDIDESTNSDTDAINTSTTGAVMLFGAPNLSDPSPGNVIKAVAIAARVRNDGGDVPRNARAVMEIADRQYAAPFNFAMGPGFAGAVTVFDRDPSTQAAWNGVTNFNSPFGIEAME